MAEAPKNDPTFRPETFALYYFPEIPAHGQQRTVDKRKDATFISGTASTVRGVDSGEGAQESLQSQAAIEDAFNRGLEKGRADMMAAYEERFEKSTAALTNAMDELARVHHRDIALKESEIVRLAVAIAKRIIGDARNDASVVQHVVTKAIQKVSDPRELTIRLNPEDVDVIAEMKATLLPGEDSDTVIHLQPDASIGRGGCIIETKLGDVDARIEQQVSIIETMLSAELTRDLPAK